MDTTFAQRLRELRRAHNKTLRELAEHCQVSAQAAQQWETGVTVPRGPKVERLASFYGIKPAELMFGQPAIGSEQAQRNVESMGDRQRAVPLISFVQAGAWLEASDPYNVGDAEEWLPCPVKHGPRTYALRVRGESMHNPSGTPSFVDGDIIFCDPDRPALHRSLVIARLDDSKEATFKRLLMDGDKCYLEALNPAWPNRIFEISENASITGVVIARLESFV